MPVPRRLDTFSANSKEVARSDHSYIAILRDLLRPQARPLGEISFGQCLQTPGDPPEQMLPVGASRFFLKHLLIFFAQFRNAGPAQALNLLQHCRVHCLLFLSVTVNHRSMDAPFRPASKWINLLFQQHFRADLTCIAEASE